MGFAVVIAFLSLFLLGFPVVYAILLPSIAYVVIEGLPLGLLAQRITYALQFSLNVKPRTRTRAPLIVTSRTIISRTSRFAT